MKKVLAVFAHPDDEAFGPGGTIALWTSKGIEVHLLCATKGEAGTDDDDDTTASIRSVELEASAKVLGIKSIEYLNFLDGKIGNLHMVELEKIISKKIRETNPDILLTFNMNGVSGHLDHIAVASATTKAFIDTKIANELYYFTNPKKLSEQIEDYFVYMPDGIEENQADEVIDISTVWDTKLNAMQKHQSQSKDIQWITEKISKLKKEEYFVVKKMP